MDYEKLYKKSLERASKLRFQNPFDTVSQMMEHVFPELKESEDERIRKAIVEMILDTPNVECEENYNVRKEDALAWLEKQGKPTVIISKFRVGDEIKTSNEESLTITKIDEKGYWSEDLFICNFDDADKWKLVHQRQNQNNEE